MLEVHLDCIGPERRQPHVCAQRSSSQVPAQLVKSTPEEPKDFRGFEMLSTRFEDHRPKLTVRLDDHSKRREAAPFPHVELRELGRIAQEMIDVVLNERGRLVPPRSHTNGSWHTLSTATSVVSALSGQGISAVTIPPRDLALFVVIAAIAGFVAARLPAWRASRLDVLEAIAHE